MNPTMTSSNRKEYSAQDIMKIAEGEDVRLIQLRFVDIHGAPKQMTVHVDMLDKALNNEIMLDGSSIQGFRSIETSDMFFFPDRASFQVLPWTVADKKIASLCCDIYNPDQTPFEGCPRNNLKRVLAKAAKTGYIYNVGPELEFFLFQKDHDGLPTLETHDQAGYYDLSPDDLGEEVRCKIVETLENLGFEVEASHHEVANGQHEIDFKYADALTTADNVITFRTVTRKIASEYGLHATFMPKPIFGINGSGMHCNQSLSTLQGANCFVDDKGDYQLSQAALQFIAGLLHHARSFTAVTNPLVNSYKRLVPGYEAPVYIAWSPSNRSALIRVPAKRGNSTRVELRSPDPSSNPYLSFAMMLTAGLDGIERKMQVPAPTQLNIYKLDEALREEHSIESLPGSLWEAMGEFQKSTIAKEALGEHIYQEFIKAKTKEWNDYRTSVSPWELDQYMSKF